MARSFFITRAAANSEDPTALEFWPAKGSDELHEALKEAFPFEANLTARMRAAVIEFLLQEQQAEQLTPISSEYLPSPQSSFVSTMPSPGTTSPQFQQDAALPRRESAGQRSLQEGMDVWQLPNKPQAKVHTRRTMTVDEKKAYKQKRIAGACADCKRRRRKCEHSTAFGATSPVSQKVGKHKKRAAVSVPATKPDPAAFDFSWSEPAFAFENDLAAMAMPLDAEMPSFDLDTTEFDFAPDLSADWQLFPDLSRAATHVDVSPTWSSDYASFDSSSFSPRADLIQSRGGRDVASGGLVTNIFDMVPPDHEVLDGGVVTAKARAKANAPMTPQSLSPMSRTQSASGLLDQNNYSTPQDGSFSYASSPATVPAFSVGAHMEQSLVSLGRPDQVPLTPSTLSPLSRSQSLHEPFGTHGLGEQSRSTLMSASSAAGQQNNLQSLGDSPGSNALSPTATANGCRFSTSASAVILREGRSTTATTKSSSQRASDHNQQALRDPDVLLRRERYKEPSALYSPTAVEHYQGSTTLSKSLTSRNVDSALSSLSPNAAQQSLRSPRPSLSQPSVSQPSTMSRLSFTLDQDQLSRTNSQTLAGLVQYREVLSRETSTKNGSSLQGKSQSYYAQAQQTIIETASYSSLAMSPNEWSLAQAPICVALYESFNIIAQSNSGLTLMINFVLSAMMVLSLSNLVSSGAMASSRILSYSSTAVSSPWKMPAMTVSGKDSRSERSGLNDQLSKKLAPAKRWSSSHLSLLTATVKL